MRRLRDEVDSPDSALVRAARLLALAAPLDPSRFLNLQPVQGTHRVRALSLRMAAVVAFSLGSFAASAAVLPHLHTWNAPWVTIREVARPSVAQAVPSIQPVPRSVAASTGPAAAIPEEVAPLVAPAQPSAAKAQGRRLPAPLRAANAAPPKAAASDGPQPDAESLLIVDAVRALRRDRDPQRALSLAEAAMERYPHGVEVEEATAVGLEAASAAGDDATARRLAEQYLASFRTGHFADRAQQILSAPLR